MSIRAHKANRAPTTPPTTPMISISHAFAAGTAAAWLCNEPPAEVADASPPSNVPVRVAVTSPPTKDVARNVERPPPGIEVVRRKTLVWPGPPPPPGDVLVGDEGVEESAAAADEEAAALESDDGRTTSKDVLAEPTSVVTREGCAGDDEEGAGAGEGVDEGELFGDEVAGGRGEAERDGVVVIMTMVGADGEIVTMLVDGEGAGLEVLLPVGT